MVSEDSLTRAKARPVPARTGLRPKATMARILTGALVLAWAALLHNLAFAFELPVAGRKLLIRDHPDDPARRKIVWAATDPAIIAGERGTDEDPRCAPEGGDFGGSLRFFSNGTGESTQNTGRIPLPCKNWSAIGSETHPRGYRYRDREQDDGPCSSVLIKDRKLIRVKCSAQAMPLGYDLTQGTNEGLIGVLLNVGFGGIRYCAEFDDVNGRDGSDGRRFQGGTSSPPSPCPRAPGLDRNGDGEVQIVCLGDSNTAWVPGTEPRWCELLDARFVAEGLPDWRAVGRGFGGATAIDLAGNPDPNAPPVIDAYDLLWFTLENDAPDAAIFAFGTNDSRNGAAAEEILAAYQELESIAEAEEISTFIALTPPVFPPEPDPNFFNAEYAELNLLIQISYPEEAVIDFSTPMVHPDDYLDDGLHMNPSGHEKRASAAFEKMTLD